MQEEQEGKEVQPKQSQEVPVDSRRLESDGVALMDDASEDADAIDHQVNEPKHQVQDVDHDQGPDVSATAVGGLQDFGGDGLDHQGVVRCVEFSACRIVNQDLTVVAEIVVLAIDGVAFVECREVVPTKRRALLRVGRVPAHAHRREFFPALKKPDNTAVSERTARRS